MSAAARVTGGGENQRTPRRIGELRVSSIMMSSPRRKSPLAPLRTRPRSCTELPECELPQASTRSKVGCLCVAVYTSKGESCRNPAAIRGITPSPQPRKFRADTPFTREYTHRNTHTNTNKHAALCGRVTRPAAGCAPSTRACPPRADRRARRLRSRTGSATRRPRAPAAARPKA